LTRAPGAAYGAAMRAIRAYQPADREALHALMREPVLSTQFRWLLENHELDDPLNHPFAGPVDVWVAEGDGELAGFSTAFRIDSARGEWGLVRVGVRPGERRRGLGRSLFAHARGSLARRAAAGSEMKISYWEPSEGSEAFARAHGFTHDRYFWEMERPGREAPAVRWPEGIETRTWDGSDRGLEEWNDCYNVAFADNAMTGSSRVEECRRMTQQSHFRPSGLLLAYRDGRCVGFCRCALHPEYGDVDVLGVVPEARGIGLGRSLVRWGTAWLLENGAPNVRLTVDAENARAADLYTSEGFEVTKTRRIWSQPL
jgi:mycothiol synthase